MSAGKPTADAALARLRALRVAEIVDGGQESGGQAGEVASVGETSLFVSVRVNGCLAAVDRRRMS